MTSRQVRLPQARPISVSERVALGLRSPGVIVTWFVTCLPNLPFLPNPSASVMSNHDANSATGTLWAGTMSTGRGSSRPLDGLFGGRQYLQVCLTLRAGHGIPNTGVCCAGASHRHPSRHGVPNSYPYVAEPRERPRPCVAGALRRAGWAQVRRVCRRPWPGRWPLARRPAPVARRRLVLAARRPGGRQHLMCSLGQSGPCSGQSAPGPAHPRRPPPGRLRDVRPVRP